MADLTLYSVKGSQLTTAEIDDNFNNLNADKFERSTILGTVSQASGVPTGAIIESGSNANGAYTRWADGTQICIGRLDIAATANALSTPAIAYPATFSAAPVVNTNLEFVGTTYAFDLTNIGANSVNNGVNATIMLKTTTTQTYTVGWTATGRWF